MDGHKEFTTLIDTGCNTSIIHSDLLHTLRDDDGNHVSVVDMKEPQSLLSASGGIVKVNLSASLTFHVDRVPSITLSTNYANATEDSAGHGRRH